jgi:hypothetical protein
MAPINLILVIHPHVTTHLSECCRSNLRQDSECIQTTASLAIAADMIGAGDFEAQLPISDKSIEISG